MYHQYYVKVHKYRHRACFEATPVGSATPYCSNLFTASALFPRCFSLSTDTDVGGSKQKHILLNKTCYQTCTRMYRFDSRSPKSHDSTIVHGWTWFYAVTSLTFCQTRLQALYMDVQRLIEDFRFNRCPGDGDIVKLIKVIFYTHIIISFYFMVRICIAQFPILVIFPYPLPISLLY